MPRSILPSLLLTKVYPGLLVLACFSVGNPASMAVEPEREHPVQEVANRLIGTMDTVAQSTTNPNVAPIQMTTCRIAAPDLPSDQDTVWLYQEQAAIDRLNQPYRQRILRLSWGWNRQVVASESFKPTDLSTWVNFCQQPAPQRVVLGRPVCTVYLKRSGQDYVGRTPVDGCPANYRGAVRITNRIVLSNRGMETWDRGFDQSGKQVWGAATDSYQFLRSQPVTP